MPKKTTAPVGSRLSHVYVPGVGPSPSRVMLVGEGPGKQEDRYREPFVGPTGQLLTGINSYDGRSIFEEVGLVREEMYITNIVKRRVQDDADPTPEEVELFRPDLLAELDRVQPEIVIAAGGFATRFFLGEDAALDQLHGLPQVSTDYGVAVVPCYHPASMLHDSDNAQVVYWDYLQAARFIRGEIDVHVPKPSKVKVLPLNELLEWPTLGMHAGVDTEDLVSGEPWCATLSDREGAAFFIEASDSAALDRFRQFFRRAQSMTCYIHNSLHDLDVLRKLGVELTTGLFWGSGPVRVVDTQVLAYEQGRLHTQGLKNLVYRLLDVEMTGYMEVVGPVAQQRALDYLNHAYLDTDDPRLPVREWHKPEPEMYWDDEARKLKTRRPQGVGQRLKRILSDHTKKPSTDLLERWANIPEHLQQEVEEVLGPFPRTDLSHCDRTRAIHYACSDAAWTRALGRYLETRHVQMNLNPIARLDHGQIPMVERMEKVGLPANKEYFLTLGAEMKQMQAEVAETLSMVVGRPVNPNSSDQVAQLLYDEMKLPVVKMTKAHKPSTGKKALQHLRESNLLVDYIMEAREYGKIDDAFCQNIARRIFTTEGEERAFYELMTTRVKTGRLASKNFNALAIPTRTELGRRIRYGFKCQPGRLLGTWDLNQIEMRVMAHLANDPLMVEVYNRSARKWAKWDRDLHIFTASKVYGCKPQDVKKAWRTACKSTGFGIIMGITGKGLSDQMRLYGLDPEEWPEEACDKLIQEWLKLFQGVADFQMNTRAEARRTGQVRDMFGRKFELPQTRCPLSWIREEALRQSHALVVQSSAQGIEKMAMAQLHQDLLPQFRAEWGWYVEPCLQVHDELILEFDEEAADLLDALMLDTLTTQVVMRVPVEAGGAIGQSWGDLEK